jgi:uncharacterized protein YoxC
MDDTQQNRLYEVLGELRADMKHLLTATARQGQAVEDLRSKMEQDTKQLNERLSKVEKFNTRVVAYATLLIPVLMIVLQWGLPALLTLI